MWWLFFVVVAVVAALGYMLYDMFTEGIRVARERREAALRLVTFKRGPLAAFTSNASGDQVLCEYTTRAGKRYRAGVGQRAYMSDIDILWEQELT